MISQPLKLECGSDIDQLIKMYSDMIYRLASANVASKNDADDVYQDVFLKYIKCVKKGITFESEEHRKAWLIRVTVNHCKSLNTSAWYKKTCELDENIYSKDNEFSDARIDFNEALMQIPQKYRSVIHLFYYEQLSVEQISNILNVKQSTIRTQLVRARAQLKEILKGTYFDEE